MQENYELYFILNPESTTEEVDSFVELCKNLIENELKGKNFKVDLQGVKKLSYPIKKNRTGYYALIEFECETKPASITSIEKKLNIHDKVLRYILVNQTEYYKAKSKEKLNTKPEFTHHRDLNKGLKEKKCIVKYLGIKAIDYKDYEFLSQFTSPYAKIFSSERTGVSAKYQRKIKKAIKRARHMALMPFTTVHAE